LTDLLLYVKNKMMNKEKKFSKENNSTLGAAANTLT